MVRSLGTWTPNSYSRTAAMTASTSVVVPMEAGTTQAKTRDLDVDFDRLLNNETEYPLSLDEFRYYLSAVEISAENLDFYMDVEKLKKIREDEAKRQLATAICKSFVADGAEREVNLSSHSKSAILSKFNGKDELTVDVFRPAQYEIYHLMKTDTFGRFVRKAVSTNLNAHACHSFLKLALGLTLLSAVALGIMVGLSAPIFWRLITLPVNCYAALFFDQQRRGFCVFLARKKGNVTRSGQVVILDDAALLLKRAMLASRMKVQAVAIGTLATLATLALPNASGTWNL